MNNCFADNFEDDFGGRASPEAVKAALAQPRPAHIEHCFKCGGSGFFRGYRGQVLGPCYACKGKGQKVFATSAEDRAKNRAQAAARKARQGQEALDAFAAQHPREWAWIDGAKATFAFAQSMVEAISKYGDLTENQLAACTRAADKREAAQAARQDAIANAPVVDMTKIVEAFANASRTLKRPKVRLAGLTISPAKATSANAGALYVKASNGDYLGKIMNSKFMRSRECTDAAESKVIEFAKDPLAAAVAFGRETGTCCCCGAELTNPKSIAAGIGPICAGKFGWSL